MVITPQSFGDLIVHHPHAHAICSLGLFRRDGVYVPMDDVDFSGLEETFRERFLALMLRREKVRPETVERMGAWEHYSDQKPAIPEDFSISEAVVALAGGSRRRERCARGWMRNQGFRSGWGPLTSTRSSGTTCGNRVSTRGEAVDLSALAKTRQISYSANLARLQVRERFDVHSSNFPANLRALFPLKQLLLENQRN